VAKSDEGTAALGKGAELNTMRAVFNPGSGRLDELTPVNRGRMDTMRLNSSVVFASPFLVPLSR
jgi:hypothetical protein